MVRSLFPFHNLILLFFIVKKVQLGGLRSDPECCAFRVAFLWNTPPDCLIEGRTKLVALLLYVLLVLSSLSKDLSEGFIYLRD